MIRIWLSREGPPIREQLSAQLLLGILSGQLAGGARLPSVREFARRLKIHRNTVSAVYQDLEARGWLEIHAGSGVFVAPGRAERLGGIDAFARLWLEQAQAHGYAG
jgi:DNA-binding transcriptional regulator YhcF (GntR family)